MTADAQAQRSIDALSNLALCNLSPCLDRAVAAGNSVELDLDWIYSLDSSEREKFLVFANTHHVLVRVLDAMQEFAEMHNDPRFHGWAERRITAETSRIEKAVQRLQLIVGALEAHGGKTVVIKSLDHWPDIGSDLDLYTTADKQRVEQIMVKEFKAKVAERSWGDRLGNKWNFEVPGLPELVEIHVRYLGQTGEHVDLARRVVERRTSKTVAGCTFYVPAPEERIFISTLQRMYRHFYFRLCDMVDVAALLRSKAVDFKELKQAAEAGGIWPGVEAFLLLVSRYVASYGEPLELPDSILNSPNFSGVRVSLGNGFLRVPKLPAAGLYGKQLLSAGAHLDFRAMFRLPLLPPLAVSALVAYRLTGSDKGVW